MSISAQPFRRGVRSVRMTFRYSQGDIELVRRQEVDALAPSSLDVAERDDREQARFYVELHDGAGRAIYRRVLSELIRTRAEVPDDRGGFTNVSSVPRTATFSVLVPNLPDAQELALFASPLAERAALEQAREIVVRAPLRGEIKTAKAPRPGRKPKGDTPEQRTRSHTKPDEPKS